MRGVDRFDQGGGLRAEVGAGRGQGIRVARGDAVGGAGLLAERLRPALRQRGRGALKLAGRRIEPGLRALVELGRLALGVVFQACDQRVVGVLLAGEGGLPCRGRRRGCGAEAGRQCLQLLLHGGADGLLQGAGLARHACQRGLHHRLQCRADRACAAVHAGLHRGDQRGGELGLGRFGAGMEAFLARGLLRGGVGGLPFDAGDHGLQAFDQFRHQRGLLLQQAEGFLTLERLRMRVQRGGDRIVQPLRDQHALAPAEGRQQAEDGRRGHARDRGAESETQPLDRRGQRAADRVDVGGAFQRQAGAAQGHHHAQQGAQHAQQHQQADQVRRERRGGQGDAFAFHAQAHGLAQAGMQRCQPGLQAVARGRGVVQRVGERCGGLAIALQFHGTGHVARADHQGDHHAQGVRADVADADPADDGQAGEEEGGGEGLFHQRHPGITGYEARRAARRWGGNAGRVRPAGRPAGRGGTAPARRCRGCRPRRCASVRSAGRAG